MTNSSVCISKIIIVLSLASIFQSCASLSKEECQSANWDSIGYRDGSNGLTERRIDDHQKACAEYKISPDSTAYMQGRARGLEQVYCKPRNGYYEGLHGSRYRNVCPQYLEANFLSAYHYGHHIYDLGQEAIQLRAKMESENVEIEASDEEIHALRDEMKHRKKKNAKKKKHKKSDHADTSHYGGQHDEHKEKARPHHDKSWKQLRRELREARKQRNHALHHQEHLDHQLHQLEEEILHLKSSRPYR